MNYNLFEEIPSVAEYLNMRSAVNLSPKSVQGAEIGLKNSCHSVCIRNQNGTLISMGRIVGDGGTVFQLVDIMTVPEEQGKGFGKQVLNELMKFINDQDEQSYINLIASKDGKPLYEKFGFVDAEPSIAMKFVR